MEIHRNFVRSNQKLSSMAGKEIYQTYMTRKGDEKIQRIDTNKNYYDSQVKAGLWIPCEEPQWGDNYFPTIRCNVAVHRGRETWFEEMIIFVRGWFNPETDDKKNVDNFLSGFVVG